MGDRQGIEASQGRANAFDFEPFASSEVVDIIHENDLKKLSRGPLRNLLQSPGDHKTKFRVWDCLLHTLSVPTLSPAHWTTLCNAMSVFLESTLKSQDVNLRQVMLSEGTWFSVFDLILDVYDDARTKPMKQLLATMAKIIVEHPDSQVSSAISARVVENAAQTIVTFQPRSRLKASLASLEIFLRKGAVTIHYLVDRSEMWLWDHPDVWVPLHREHCIEIGVPLPTLTDPEERPQMLEDHVRGYAAQILGLSLLLNARSEDRSLTAGTLFCQLCCNVSFDVPRHTTSGGQTVQSTPFWVAPLKYISLMTIGSMQVLSNHVFHPLFKTKPSHFRTFLGSLPFEELKTRRLLEVPENEVSLLFSFLEAGRELGLVQEDDVSTHQTASKDEEEHFVVLQPDVLRYLLLHPDPHTRLSALSLLVADPSTTKPLSYSALSLLKETIPYVHAENDPHSRGELLTLLRKLVTRLRSAFNATQQSLFGPSSSRDSGDSTRPFITWYVEFLEGELRPGASYQTHVVALRILILLLQSGLDPRIDPAKLSRVGQVQRNWPADIEIFRPGLFRVVGDLLLDNFDEVREAALTLLRLFPVDFLNECSSNGLKSGVETSSLFSQLIVALSRAEDTASRSGRAGHTDTVARLYHFLFDLALPGVSHNDNYPFHRSKYNIVEHLLESLEEHRSSSDEIFLGALRGTPLHGRVSALRLIVGTPDFHEAVTSGNGNGLEWRSFHERIMSLCNRIWEVVRPVLCIDSPETEQDTSNEEIVGPKDILSCSWRALRESSLLLHAILMNSTYAPDHGDDAFGFADLERIGSLSFTQLSELRHRGAFCTVSQTFASCCQRCGSAEDIRICGLPELWYQRILAIIDTQSSKLTRRSAGLPALITGVASSGRGQPLFQRIMMDLRDIAKSNIPTTSDESLERLPQVHALNCLKDLFINPSFGQNTEPSVMPALNISADCLGSHIWAIRNCGLMLFRALMVRMRRRTLGTKVKSAGDLANMDNSPKIPFANYPQLVPLLSRLLEAPDAKPLPEQQFGKTSWELSISTERVFPALELIGNKLQSAATEDDTILRQLVFSQTARPVWGIRDHAARIFASLVDKSEILRTAEELCYVKEPIDAQNELHGRILTIRYLFQRLWAGPGYSNGDFKQTGEVVSTVLVRLGESTSSPVTKAALFEILNDAIEGAIRRRQEDELLSGFIVPVNDLGTFLDQVLGFEPGSSYSRASALLISALAYSIMSAHIIGTSATADKLSSLLERISTADPDAGASVLERLAESFSGYQPSRALMLEFYRRIILDTQFNDVQKVAISALANELDECTGSPDSIHDELVTLIAPDSLSVTLERCMRDQSASRELVNAILHLQGHILALRLVFSGHPASPGFQSDVDRQVVSMAFAMEDETEFTTRHAAVLSMKGLFRGLHRSRVRFRHTPQLIDIYMVLYDMLNDDDEELRDLAAEAASIIFVEESSSPRLPLAASAQLARFLVASFPGSPRLFEAAVRRFLGRIREKRISLPVSVTLADTRLNAGILFAEEKQNLYIDDIREVERWSEVLCRLICEDKSTDIASEFHTWVENGLDTLVDATPEEARDGMLGWTSNPDVYNVGARVIRGAEILLRTMSFKSGSFDPQLIRNKLQSFLEIGWEKNLHERWMLWVQSALDSESV